MKGFKGTKGEWVAEYDNSDYSPSEWYDILSEKGNVLRRNYNERDFQEEEMRANALLISNSLNMLERLYSNKLVLENTVTYLMNLLAIVEPHERLKLETNILLLESEIIDTGNLIKQAT